LKYEVLLAQELDTIKSLETELVKRKKNKERLELFLERQLFPKSFNCTYINTFKLQIRNNKMQS